MGELLVCAALAATTMVATHYTLPRLHRRMLDEIDYLERATVGVVLGLLVPYAAWVWTAGAWAAGWASLGGLVAIAFGAGIGTAGAYALDAWGSLDGEPGDEQETERRRA